MKKLFLLIGLITPLSVNAGLELMSDTDLYQVEGQGGADISLNLSLNHNSNYGFDTGVCPTDKLEYCRLGISVNNRVDASGKKQWVVFKGVQGTVKIQEIKLTGTDITFGASTKKAAIQLAFDPAKPIQIRNLGFQSMSMETDSHVEPATGTPPVGFLPGYLSNTKYVAGNTFDGLNPVTGAAREKGFLGLNMHGNLALTGNIKIFGCGTASSAGGHPRC